MSPPFWPNVPSRRRVIRSRGGSPTPTHRTEDLEHDHRRRRRHPPGTRERSEKSDTESLLPDRRRNRNSDFIQAIPEDPILPGDCNDTSNHYAYKETEMPSPRNNPERDAGLDHPRPAGKHADRPVSDRHRSTIPFGPIYESILLLRKHGATVRLKLSDIMTATATAQQASSGKAPINFDPIQSTSVDSYNPTIGDIKQLDQALTTVIYSGGEVELHPLTTGREQSVDVIKCHDCPASFKCQHEAEDHYSYGENVCNICKRTFACRGQLNDHLVHYHRMDGLSDNMPNDSFDTCTERSFKSRGDEKHRR